MLFIKLFVPFGEVRESFFYADGRAEIVIVLESGAVGVGYGDIAGLHRDEFFMGFEVIVLGEYTVIDERMLECVDVVEQVFRGAAADVVDGIWRDRQTVFAGFFFRCTFHDAIDTFDDVVDVGEVAFAVAVVEDFDCLASLEIVRGREVEHVGAASGAVDGEESQASGREIVEF